MRDKGTEPATLLRGGRISRLVSSLRRRLRLTSRAPCAWSWSAPDQSESVAKPVQNQLESVHMQAVLPMVDQSQLRKSQFLAHHDSETHAKYLVSRIYEEAIAPSEVLVADLR